MENRKWMGQKHCDICATSLCEEEKDFVDGKTIRGPWAVMCNSCFKKYGVGIGTGKGQSYDPKTFIKTGG